MSESYALSVPALSPAPWFGFPVEEGGGEGILFWGAPISLVEVQQSPTSPISQGCQNERFLDTQEILYDPRTDASTLSLT